MEAVSSFTATNSPANPRGSTLSCVRGLNPGPPVVVLSDFAATTQALLNSLQGSLTNYFTRPIGVISRMLGDADLRDAMSTVQTGGNNGLHITFLISSWHLQRVSELCSRSNPWLVIRNFFP